MKESRDFPTKPAEVEPTSAFAWLPTEYNLEPGSFGLNYGMPPPRSFSQLPFPRSPAVGSGAAGHDSGEEQPFTVMRREKKELARLEIIKMRDNEKAAGTTSLCNVDNNHGPVTKKRRRGWIHRSPHVGLLPSRHRR